MSCNVPSIKQALANIQPDTVQSANRPGNAKNHSVSSPEAYKNNYPEERSLDDDVKPRDVNKSRNVIGKLATPHRLTVFVCFLLSRMMSDYSVLRVLIRLDRWTTSEPFSHWWLWCLNGLTTGMPLGLKYRQSGNFDWFSACRVIPGSGTVCKLGIEKWSYSTKAFAIHRQGCMLNIGYECGQVGL